MPSDIPATDRTRIITFPERARLVALLARLARLNPRTYGRKVVLDNGFECVVRGDSRAITAQIYRRNDTEPGITVTLSRSVSLADLRRLRDGFDPTRYSLKMARRMERREKVLNDIASQIVGNRNFAALVRG